MATEIQIQQQNNGGATLILKTSFINGLNIAKACLIKMGPILNGLKPTPLMIIVQIIYAFTFIFYKLSLSDGMSASVLTAYRLIFSVPFTVALALAFERNKKPTWKVMLLSFFTGLFGGNLLNNLFLEAEDLASATLVTAVYNLTPALTFIYSIFAGLETMSVQIAAGKAKLFGTITGIGGCMLLTFLKGPKIIGVGTFGMNFIHKISHAAAAAATHVSLIRKLLGLLASFGSSINFTAWLIIQSKISLQYPHTYSSAALMSVMGATQATIYAICVEKDWSVWHLTSPIRI